MSISDRSPSLPRSPIRKEGCRLQLVESVTRKGPNVEFRVLPSIRRSIKDMLWKQLRSVQQISRLYKLPHSAILEIQSEGIREKLAAAERDGYLRGLRSGAGGPAPCVPGRRAA